MSGLTLFNLLSPRMVLPFLRYLFPVALILRWLSSSFGGALLSVSALYLATTLWSTSQPYGPEELVLWLDNLASDGKIAVVTTLITLAGFLVAFHTATVNWKEQALTTLKLGIAAEITAFYQEFSTLTIDTENDVRSMISNTVAYRANDPTTQTVFGMKLSIEAARKFSERRKRMSVLSIEVHGILGRHFSILSSMGGAVSAMNDGISAVSVLAKDMWIVLPYIYEGDPEAEAKFSAQLDLAPCHLYIESCKLNRLRLSIADGSLRGVLLQALVPVNWSTYLTFLNSGPRMRLAIQRFAARRKG